MGEIVYMTLYRICCKLPSVIIRSYTTHAYLLQCLHHLSVISLCSCISQRPRPSNRRNTNKVWLSRPPASPSVSPADIPFPPLSLFFTHSHLSLALTITYLLHPVTRISVCLFTIYYLDKLWLQRDKCIMG
jgi:hypothetical protein